MKTFKLEATPREALGKKASKDLRKEGFIPAVLYGSQPVALPYDEPLRQGEKMIETGDNRGIVVVDFAVTFDGIRKLIYTPEIFLVEIDIKGCRVVKAILKDIQFHPVSDDILHVDFLEVFDKKPIEMEIPVFLTGHAAGVKSGGKLNQSMRKLKVRGLSERIPEKLEVNVNHLELGKAIKVGELSFEGIELINPKNSVLCIVKMTRASQSAASAANT